MVMAICFTSCCDVTTRGFVAGLSLSAKPVKRKLPGQPGVAVGGLV